MRSQFFIFSDVVLNMDGFTVEAPKGTRPGSKEPPAGAPATSGGRPIALELQLALENERSIVSGHSPDC